LIKFLQVALARQPFTLQIKQPYAIRIKWRSPNLIQSTRKAVDRNRYESIRGKASIRIHSVNYSKTQTFLLEACNELLGPICDLAPRQQAELLVYMLKRWRAICYIVQIW